MVQENTIKVDSNPNIPFHHEASQHTPIKQEKPLFIKPFAVIVTIPIVETNEPLIDQGT